MILLQFCGQGKQGGVFTLLRNADSSSFIREKPQSQVKGQTVNPFVKLCDSRPRVCCVVLGANHSGALLLEASFISLPWREATPQSRMTWRESE